MAFKAVLNETTAWIKIIGLLPSVPLSVIHRTTHRP